MRTFRRLPLLALAAALLAACKGEQGGATPTPSQPSVPAGTPSAGGTPGMGGMQGMQGMQEMGGANTMGQMQAHLRMMQGAAADSLKVMLPTHRQAVANMISQMNGEMRGMHMPPDAGWTATADSLRHDLVRMPEMSGAELKAMMPAHVGRVTRFMDMHRAMMGGAGQPGTGGTAGRVGG